MHTAFGLFFYLHMKSGGYDMSKQFHQKKPRYSLSFSLFVLQLYCTSKQYDFHLLFCKLRADFSYQLNGNLS